MGCSMSYEGGEPEVEIIEGDEISSQYPSGCSIWCYIRPLPRQLDHEQAPSNEPVDISLCNKILEIQLDKNKINIFIKF